MGVIPRKIYRLVEWQLHNADETARLLREDLEDVLDRSLAGGSIAQACSGAPGDPTARTALLLCQQQLDRADSAQWLACIAQTQNHFRDSITGQVALNYYGQNRTVLQVAENMHYDKQSINRYRDRYVAYLALLAASLGLIDMGGEAWGVEVEG